MDSTDIEIETVTKVKEPDRLNQVFNVLLLANLTRISCFVLQEGYRVSLAPTGDFHYGVGIRIERSFINDLGKNMLITERLGDLKDLMGNKSKIKREWVGEQLTEPMIDILLQTLSPILQMQRTSYLYTKKEMENEQRK